MADLPQVEKLLCERYNVRSLDGPLKEAIDAGDVTTLKALIEDRDMYRWNTAIQKALATPAEAPVSRMTRRDLVATAQEQEVEVPEGATVSDLRDALTAEPEPEEPVEEEEHDSGSSRSRRK